MRCMAAYRYMPDELRRLVQEYLDEITLADCETLFTRDDMLIYGYLYDKKEAKLSNPAAYTLYHESVFITIWRKYCICGKCSSV